MDDHIRILHLEDNPRDAQLVRDILGSEGLSCEFCHTETRKAFESALGQEAFDVILCDNNLPDYDGFTALQLAHRKHPLTPFIIISGTLDEDEAVKSLQYGATDYLLKGRLERLAPAVKRALEEAREKRELAGAEEKLRRNEERMRLALAATNDAVWDWDLENDTIDGNEVFERLLGRPPLSGGTRAWWHALVHPEDQQRVESTLNGAISAGEPFWNCSYRVRRINGDWADVNNRACLARNASNVITRLVGAIQDVTEHIAAEHERNAIENQLRHAQKMEAIGTLAGGIAHDFNNILGIILSNAELINAEIKTGHPAQNEITESAEEILLATTRARDLVRQILTFSRRTESQRTVIKAQPVAEECVKFLRSTIPAMVTITSRIDPACSPIVCDPTQLHQIVMNLCTNAWHALPEKNGRLEIQVEEVDGSKVPNDRDEKEKAPSYVCISIRDNGHGMSASVQARVFEPFFTTKSPGEGTGLGLSVVHGIVKSNGGVIKLDSTPGKGTRFDVFFPVEADEAEETTAAGVEIVRGSGERILLIDDNVAFARGLERTLHHQGYKVEVCHSPRVGLDLFRKDPSRYNLVITDLSMPRMSGIELSSHLLDIRPNLPLIVISGSFGLDEKQRAQFTTRTAFLTKPVAPLDLSEAVNRLLRLESK